MKLRNSATKTYIELKGGRANVENDSRQVARSRKKQLKILKT